MVFVVLTVFYAELTVVIFH